MDEVEAKLFAEVLEALYSDYPYGVTARAYEGELGYWFIFLDDGSAATDDKFYSKAAVLDQIRQEVKL